MGSRITDRDFPGGPVTKTPSSQCSRLGWSPGQGTRSHMLQPRVCMRQQRLKILHAAPKTWHSSVQFSSVQFSCLVVSDSSRPHGLHHSRPPCPSPTPRVYSNSCPLSQWCYPTISSSIIPFSSHFQSCPASGSFKMRQFFASGSQNIGISTSASVLPMNIQDWFPLGWTGWISLQSKGLSRVFTTTVQKHQFFGAQLSL